MKKTIFLICLYLLTNIKIEAQSLLERTRNRVKEKIEQRIEEKTDEAVDKGLDKTEDAIKKSGKKVKKQTTTTDTNQTTEESDEETNGAKTNKTKMESYTKYDFIPGDKVLYFEDFSQDAIGDFPALWTTNGGGEVKTVNIASGNWFHMNKEDAVYCYTKQILFPENFIMEFDIIPDGDFANGYSLTFYEDPGNTELTDDLYPGTKGVHISFEEGRWYTKGYNNSMDVGGWIEGESTTNPVVLNQVNHVIVWVQNRRLRIYHQGAKAFDMPTNIHAGTKFNRLRFSGWSTHSTPYVSNIKVTTAAPDTRSKLITEGKLVSYGIYFDVNKDVAHVCVPALYFNPLTSVDAVLPVLLGLVKVKVLVEPLTAAAGVNEILVLFTCTLFPVATDIMTNPPDGAFRYIEPAPAILPNAMLLFEGVTPRYK